MTLQQKNGHQDSSITENRQSLRDGPILTRRRQPPRSEFNVLRTTFLALCVVLALAGAASAQFPRSSGPANPRYYPDLYKGPAWGMTLSEYYTFGNKADGPYGYALGGYRYGSNQDIQRWKQATGTALPPGYYWQRWRDRRDERAVASTNPTANSTASAAATRKTEPTLAGLHRIELQKQPVTATEEEPEETKEETSEVANEPTPALTPPTSRRNASARGLTSENLTKSVGLAGPEQSDAGIHATNKFRRIRATDPTAGDDKN
jgi:hypothetical protein